ncbi:toxin [Candidatus Woesebacteria bacterium GWA1_41_8]|uniref:Toxin n=1 Tax=Candidatus Woesebacteria bacterium GWA1_41_8 TaxID=1802471 RepID=A0A1F7WI71_9BACT|nr:MAG: toxin [Candidatus Woesebacteria bacterium GWA1_41_8]
MKYFDWNKEKNELLKIERDISFEEVFIAIESGGLLEIVRHSNQKKYPNQKFFVVNINNYVYLVPFVEDEEKIFLKTIIPSRKATEKYLVKGGDKK